MYNSGVIVLVISNRPRATRSADLRGLPRGVALSLCRVFLRNDVAALVVVNVAVVFEPRANVAVAL